jgi:hypothetical protein
MTLWMMDDKGPEYVSVQVFFFAKNSTKKSPLCYDKQATMTEVSLF